MCVTFLTGCGGRKLDRPYVFSERIFLYPAPVTADRAESFAADLCVVREGEVFPEDGVNAEAAAVFDLEGRRVIFAKNPFERLAPASVTKILTALVALKKGNLQDRVTVTEGAVITEAGATLCGIKPGDTLTLEQLLYGLMLPSGNDAGAAIAIYLAGSEEKFAAIMNEEAKRLGATDSHFVNPHGLNAEDHYTTAYDLYLIFNEALTYPEFRAIIGERSYTADYTDQAGSSVSATWKATNWYATGERALPQGLDLLGGKTGTTQVAGSCLIMGSRDASGKEYISVVLKAQNRTGLYENMTNILNKTGE